MKKKEKVYSIALLSIVMIFLILVSSMASASPEQNQRTIVSPDITSGAVNPSDDEILSDELSSEETVTAMESIPVAALNINETRITTSGLAYAPAIYGNRIVYHDERSGNYDIYMYDLSTKKETQITTNKSGQTWPSIYGDRIAWVDWRNYYYWDIYMYDLSTKQETQITTNYYLYSGNPAIYGDRIVWSNFEDSYSDVFMYNITTKKETQVTTSGSAYNPAIYGNRIVYYDYLNGDESLTNTDIYMYDLSTSKETQISTSGSALNPAIYGNRIVWRDERNGNPDIYMYDLSTSKETRITVNSSSQYNPVIYGNRIVWTDHRNGNDDIYMYDLSTSKETQITTDGSYQWEPAIYGNRIVWQDYRNGNWTNTDIYMATISTTSPVAAFSASPTSGKAPMNVAFTDKSTGYPTKWNWTFGDGTNSTLQNPIHMYRVAGNYTVKLTATNEVGSNTTTKKNYIKVTPTNTRPGPYSSK